VQIFPDTPVHWRLSIKRASKELGRSRQAAPCKYAGPCIYTMQGPACIVYAGMHDLAHSFQARTNRSKKWYYLRVGGERTTCASTASSLNLRRANAQRPLTHSLTGTMQEDRDSYKIDDYRLEPLAPH
jgi:hypothetical protein